MGSEIVVFTLELVELDRGLRIPQCWSHELTPSEAYDQCAAELTRIPISSVDNVQSVNPTSIKTKECRKAERKAIKGHAMEPTFDIPFGSNNTSAKRTSPAKPFVSPGTALHTSHIPHPGA